MRPITRTSLLILPFCALLAPGCMQWKTPGKPVPEAIRELEAKPGRTRVTLENGERITYKSAHVDGDSLREGPRSLGGILTQSVWVALAQDGRTIPITDVRKLELNTISAGRTVVFSIGVGAAFMYLMSMMAVVY